MLILVPNLALSNAGKIIVGISALVGMLMARALLKAQKKNQLLKSKIQDLITDNEERFRKYEKTREELSGFAVDNYELAQDLKEKNQILSKENGKLKTYCSELAVEIDETKKAADFRGKLMRMAIHELKNTLNIIINTIEAPGLPENLSARIKKASYEMNDLMLNLLESGKVEDSGITIKREEFDLSVLAGKLYTKYSPICRNYSIELTNNITGSCFISADKTLIERVLNNLFSNSCKFTPPLGNISVSASVTAEDMVRIEVSDTGVGIRNEFMSKTFEEYSQDNSMAYVKSYPTGIGLAFSKAIVEAHGGKMGIITRENEGTRVWFTLQKANRSMLSPHSSGQIESTGVRFTINDNDMRIIVSELEQLRKTHIHEISEILRILKSSAFNENEKLKDLRKMIEAAAFATDEKLYKKLLYPIK
jgi:signal transduction histidine kinase